MQTAFMSEQDPSHLHLMTLNVRRRVSGVLQPPADAWTVRAPRLASLLRLERPTLLALQEALPDQVDFVHSVLGPAYRWVGRGRSASGAGEGCPVFVDTERLELLDWDQTALSTTPEEPGSRSWGTVFPRVMVRVVLRDRFSGAEFRIINTHLDPVLEWSRVRAAALVREASAAEGQPTLVTGDLNAGPGSPAVRELLAGGTLLDAWQSAGARVSPEYATYARYRAPREGKRIDWILASPEIGVERIGINGERFDGGWASDHLPVQATVVLPEADGTGSAPGAGSAGGSDSG